MDFKEKPSYYPGVIQFYHVRDGVGAGTFAIQIARPELFRRSAESFLTGLKPQIMLGIGKSRLHPKDRFEKSVGRDIALKSMDVFLASMISMEVRENTIRMLMETEEHYLTVSVSKHNDNPIIRGISEKSNIAKGFVGVVNDFDSWVF